MLTGKDVYDTYKELSSSFQPIPEELKPWGEMTWGERSHWERQADELNLKDKDA